MSNPSPYDASHAAASSKRTTGRTATAFLARPALPADGAGAGADAPLAAVYRDYVPITESAHEMYQLDLQAFRGPLDLLLFLIRRHHLDIFDIPMAFVCARYLDYLDAMEHESLDVAAEFMWMASELLHIKSRMLLPQPERTDEQEEQDPRAELVARLLALQSFKDAAEILAQQPQLGRDVFCRGEVTAIAPLPQALRRTDAWGLVAALHAALARAKPEVRHQVLVQQVPLRLSMLRLLEVLTAITEALPLTPLLAEQAKEGRLQALSTFLAVLELARRGLLRVLYQPLAGQAAVDGDGSSPADDDMTGERIALLPRFAELGAAQARLAGETVEEFV